MTREEVKKRLLSGETLDEIFPLVPGQDCVIYKADAFSATDDIIYIPDFSLNWLYDSPETEEDAEVMLDFCYSGNNFIDEAGGDLNLAERLFWYCDWQHPSSAIDEVRDEICEGETYIFDTHGGDSTWNERSGSRCVVVRELTRKECDIEDVGPMYRVRFEDGVETDAFIDELMEV